MLNQFKSSLERLSQEADLRKYLNSNITRFGISFLDEALDGILPIDLVLIGAGSGVGKTSLVSDIAYKNAALGKRVYGIFLEAFEGEIELRNKYKLLARKAVEQKKDPYYRDWIHGKQGWLDELSDQIDFRHFSNVHTRYRGKTYTIDDAKRDLLAVNDKADLIVIDHLHYFDLAGENENQEMTQLVKTLSDIVHTIKKPIILVGHIKKQDQRFGELVPGQEEFHGSSNIYKIATKVITMASMGPVDPQRSVTLVRVAKGRTDSSVTNYVAKMVFNSMINDYEPAYELGRLERDSSFRSIYNPTNHRPRWFKGGVDDK